MKAMREQQEFDYSFLRGKIVERYGTNKRFAGIVGINPVTLSLKLKNRIAFGQQEILRITRLLKLTAQEMQKAFFTPLERKEGMSDER